MRQNPFSPPTSLPPPSCLAPPKSPRTTTSTSCSSFKARIGLQARPRRPQQATPHAGIPIIPPGRVRSFFSCRPSASPTRRAMNNDGVPAPLDGYRGAAARRGGGFPGLRNRRFRAALYFAAWGVAGMMSTTVPSLAANPDHVMLYFLLLMAAVLLLLLSMAAVDMPWLERAAARLEGPMF